MKWLPPNLRGRLLLIGLLVLAGYGQYQTWTMAASKWEWYSDDGIGAGMDFYQFRCVPFVARELGMQDFYTRENRMRISKWSVDYLAENDLSPAEARATIANDRTYKGGMGASGTPFFYALFGAFQKDYYDADLKRFRLALLCVSELSILLLCIGLSYSLTRTVAMFALFSYWFSPFSGLLVVSNVNHLQLGFITACVLLARIRNPIVGPALAGAVMAIGLMFKPNPIFAGALFYLVFLARRNFVGFASASIATLITSAAAFAWSSVYFGGTACWSSWMNRTGNALKAINDWNISMTANIWKWTGVNTEFFFLGGFMLLAAILILHPRCTVRRSDSSKVQSFERTLLVLGVGLLIPLIAFRLTWEHHFTLAIPMILFALRPTPERPNQKLRYGLAIFAVALIFNLPNFFSMPRDAFVVALMCITGGLLLFGLGVAELARSKPSSVAH